MQSIGQKLRTTRLSRGLDLAELAVMTKINRQFLEEIEADNRHKLPGGFFYKSWVAQYAAALGLDSKALSAEVDHLLTGDAPPALPGQESLLLPKEMRPPPMTSGQGSGLSRTVTSVAALIAVVVGCSALYVWWHNSQSPANRNLAVEQRDVPQRAVAAAETVRQEPKALAKVEQPVSQQLASANPPGTQEADRLVIGSDPSGEVRIEVSATQETWLSISPDGKTIFAGVLQPAEMRTVAARDTAKIRVGNAGGITIRLNGKPVGPIGPSGQVRTLIISKSGVQILDAPAPVAPPKPAERPLA